MINTKNKKQSLIFIVLANNKYLVLKIKNKLLNI